MGDEAQNEEPQLNRENGFAIFQHEGTQAIVCDDERNPGRCSQPRGGDRSGYSQGLPNMTCGWVNGPSLAQKASEVGQNSE